MCILCLPTDHYFFGSTFRSSVCVTGEEVNRKVMDVFTELSRELRQLRDIPLSINSLQGTSPVFRYTEVCLYYRLEIFDIKCYFWL